MKVNFSENALTELTRLGKGISARILKKLKEIERLDNPRDSGKALVGNLAGLWRYRVGDYRIICKINDNELIILVINIKKEARHIISKVLLIYYESNQALYFLNVTLYRFL